MRIRLLGGLEVTSPEQRQVRFATRKTSLLFAALVLGGRRGYRGMAEDITIALALNPNLAVALGVWVKACSGEPDKAVEHAALAMRLSPFDPRLFAWQFNAGLAHFCAGRYEDAINWAGKSLRHEPNYPSALRVTAASYVLAGRLAEAKETIDRLCDLDPALRLSNSRGCAATVPSTG